MSFRYSRAELAATKKTICGGKHSDLQPGNTIDGHWLDVSCNVQVGLTLGSCLSDARANPDLCVETQVFTLVHSPDALNFNDLKLANPDIS